MNKIWWQKTDGASRFLSEAAEILSGGRSVVFSLPARVPWLETMREVLFDLLNEKFSGVREIETIDAQEIPKAPRKYIINNYCPNKEGFRPYDNEAYAEFLADSPDSLLIERCLWIQNADDLQAADWFDFIVDYHKFLGGRSGGVFILETSGDFPLQTSAGVEILSYANKITEYDSLAFNILTAAEFCRDNHLMKQYLAELVTRLAGDVELGAACLEFSGEFLKNPHEVFKNIAEEKNFAVQSDEDIDFAIWLTQLQSVFPLVETFRRRLIKKYYSAIAAALPCNSGYFEVEQPEQAELGTLRFLINSRRLWFDKPDWDELLSYREVRNKLAHLEILPFDELQLIFDKNSRK